MVKVKDTATVKQVARAERREQLLNRPCKFCGSPLNTLDKRQVKCGLRCPAFDAGNKLVDVECCVCKKVVQKPTKQVREFNCCSLKCQKIHAMEINRGVRSRWVVDWVARSKKAKQSYRLSHRKKRKAKSDDYRFWLIAKAGLPQKLQVDAWERKCTTASGTIKQRLKLSASRSRLKPETFEQLVRLPFRLNDSYGKLGVWEKKCYSTAKNMKWRRRLRNVKKLSLLPIEKPKEREKQLQLWE